jgi:signal peptidase I
VEPDLLTAAAALLAAVLAGLAVRRWLFFVTEIDSLSMAPSLAPGRRVLTRRLRHPLQIRRGDVLVATSPELGRVVVKRVLGLPGEQVVIESTGRVRVDGVPVPEPYVVHPGGPSGTFQVPPGHLLLLGDNRSCSSDSRHWQRPYLPLSAVRGIVIPGSLSPAAPGS